MTPDEKREFEELKKQVNDFKRMFENAAQYTPEVKRSLGQVLTAASDKTATSERVTINEAGSGTKNALGEPDRWIRIGDNNVPAYDD